MSDQKVVIVEENTTVVVSQSGPQGPRGPKGDPGAGIVVKGHYDTLDALKAAHPVGQVGDVYSVGDRLYGWNPEKSAWADLGPVGQQGPKGDPGERGEPGEPGPAGPANSLSIGDVESGDKAEAWITGDAPNQILNLGLPRGERGEQGPEGPAGPAGKDGRGLEVLGHYDTEAELRAAHPVGNPGDAWLVGAGYLYVWSTSTNDWENVGQLQGPKGDPGERGPAGEPGHDGAPGRDGTDGKDGAPGKDGEAGPANVLTIGTVQGGDQAAASITGDSPNQQLNLTLPKGPKGDKGDPGSGGAANHRLIVRTGDGYIKQESLATSDVNGYISHFCLNDVQSTVLLLNEDVTNSAKEGDTIVLTNLVGDDRANLLVFTTSESDGLYSKGGYGYCAVAPAGTARLVYVGPLDVDTEEMKIRRVWIAVGDTAEAPPDVKPKPPVLKTVVPLDEGFTAVWTFDDTAVPATSFVIHVKEPSGAIENHEVPASAREFTVTGLKNNETYTINMTAWNGEDFESDTSNAIDVIPHGDLPGAPTLISATGIWDGVQIMFRAPDDKDQQIKGYAAYINNTQYFVSDVTGTDLLTGYVHGLPSQTSDVYLVGLIPPNGETRPSVTIKDVVIGPKSVRPKLTSAGQQGVTGYLQTYFDLCPGNVRSYKANATPVKGGTPYSKTSTDVNNGWLVIDQNIPAGDYKVTIQAGYDGGWSSESSSITVTMNPPFDATAPKDWTVENKPSVSSVLLVSVNDSVKYPRTGIVVSVDGTETTFPGGPYTNMEIKDHVVAGVENTVKVAFLEPNGLRSDWSEPKKIIPNGKPVTAPSIWKALQAYQYQDSDGKGGPVSYWCSPAGITVSIKEGEKGGYTGNGFRYQISTDGGATWGNTQKPAEPTYGPDPLYIQWKIGSPNPDGAYQKYTIRIAWAYFVGTETRLSPWSEPQDVTVWSFNRLDPPTKVQMFFENGKVRTAWYDPVPEGNNHVTGIVEKISVNGKDISSRYIWDTSWKGGDVPLPDVPAGSKIGFSYAWVCWTTMDAVSPTWKPIGIWGSWSKEIFFDKVNVEAPEVVNPASPKADG